MQQAIIHRRRVGQPQIDWFGEPPWRAGRRAAGRTLTDQRHAEIGIDRRRLADRVGAGEHAPAPLRRQDQAAARRGGKFRHGAVRGVRHLDAGEPHGLSGPADRDHAIDRAAERPLAGDQRGQIAWLQRRVLRRRLNEAELSGARHEAIDGAADHAGDLDIGVEIDRGQLDRAILIGLRRVADLADIVGAEHGSWMNGDAGDIEGAGGRGHPSAVVAIDLGTVLPIDRDRADDNGAPGIEDALDLHDLMAGAPDHQIEAHLDDCGWVGGGIGPRAEARGAVTGEVDAGDRNERRFAAGREIEVERLVHRRAEHAQLIAALIGCRVAVLIDEVAQLRRRTRQPRGAAADLQEACRRGQAHLPAAGHVLRREGRPHLGQAGPAKQRRRQPRPLRQCRHRHHAERQGEHRRTRGAAVIGADHLVEQRPRGHRHQCDIGGANQRWPAIVEKACRRREREGQHVGVLDGDDGLPLHRRGR